VEVNHSSVEPAYTETQGQYLAFIYYYTKIHGVPPAEADMQRYFDVSAPSVHSMVVTLDKRQLIRRTASTRLRWTKGR
jgi:Mn-dependent DtxR family transcriptional regulator